MALQNRTPTPAPAAAPRLLDYDGLKDLGIRFSKTHLQRLEGKGAFPRRVKLGNLMSRALWSEAEIHEWISSRIAARDSVAG